MSRNKTVTEKSKLLEQFSSEDEEEDFSSIPTTKVIHPSTEIRDNIMGDAPTDPTVQRGESPQRRVQFDENAPPPSQPPTDNEGEQEISDEEMLQYGAKSVLMLIVPVSVCLLVVVTTISSVTYYTQKQGTYL